MIAGARILVADDDPALCDAVAETFEHAGATVVRADTGVGLLRDIVERGPFALVVTDVWMPWVSGVEAIRAARRAGLVVPVIVMTGLCNESVAREIRALGRPTALLRKPFSLSELHEVADLLVAVGAAQIPVAARQEDG